MYTYIKAIREKNGMEQKELASRIGIAVPTLGNYEAGRREPPLDVLVAVADLFDVSLDVLIRGKEKDLSAERSRELLFNRLSQYGLAELREILAYANYLQYRKEREQTEGQRSTDNQ